MHVLSPPGQQQLPAPARSPRPDVDALCAALAANSTVVELVLVGARMASHNDAGALAFAAFSPRLRCSSVSSRRPARHARRRPACASWSS